MPSLNDWSDGSMWMRVLEAGEYQIQKVTIFNMLDIRGTGNGTAPRRISRCILEVQQSTC